MNPMKRGMWAMFAGAACLGLLAHGQAAGSLSRNASGAKNMGEAGAITVDTAGQLEGDPNGKVWAFEAAFQYQVSTRLQFLVEAVPFTLLQPEAGNSVSGLGDADLTLSWLASGGSGLLPAVVLGAKVKVPTARNDEIGTGQLDYSALLILSREFGELDLDLETELATIGRPGGEELRDQFVYTFTAEYGLGDFLAAYGEIFGNSPPTAAESRTDAARFGLEVDLPFNRIAAPYFSFETDTEGVRAVRGGIEWTW